MEVIRTSVVYLLSIIAAFILKTITPIKFEDNDCKSTYTTRVDKENVTYIVTVQQWAMSSRTRFKIFDTTTKYYISELLILVDDKKIGVKRTFFTEPVKGWFGSTKLPHAVIALATLDKLSVEGATDQIPA